MIGIFAGRGCRFGTSHRSPAILRGWDLASGNKMVNLGGWEI